MDYHPHDHPFNFVSIILWNGYWERTEINEQYHSMFHILKRKAETPHKIRIRNSKPVTTLVFTSKRFREWGYTLNDGTWIDNQTYRVMKNNNRFDYQGRVIN